MFRLAIASVFFGIVLASSLLHITNPPHSLPPSRPQQTSDKAPRVRETNESERPAGFPRAPHGQKVIDLSHRRVELPRKRLFYAAPSDDETLDIAALVRSFQQLSLAPRPEKSCLKRPSTAVLSSPSSKQKKRKKGKKKSKKKHVHFAKWGEYFEIPCVNHELGLQDLGEPDYAGNIEMIDVDWHHDVYLEVVNDPSKSHKRFYKAAILSEWMFE
ncbi:MAG: hypothetical protein OHK93_007513 [Ramalina farinacea]|uniref:Uncharacterized protein n=1 Tax=Ramalina farinacea TaxID=258253 RepID=A0AA43QMT0_9LECA|nr:hypothetical protein [Ramalina farinacea]